MKKRKPLKGLMTGFFDIIDLEMVIVISIKQISKDKPALELLCGDLTNDFTEDLPHALEFDVQQRLFPNFTFNSYLKEL